MATVKNSKKKKIVSIICIILVIALVVGSIFAIRAKKNTVTVSLSTIATDDIVEKVNATGKVTAGAIRDYKVGAVATCKEVFVKVGDEVKKGDKLATFDTSTLDAEIASVQQVYQTTKLAYEDSLNKQNIAKKNLDAVNKQIAILEEKISNEEEADLLNSTESYNVENNSRKAEPVAKASTSKAVSQPVSTPKAVSTGEAAPLPSLPSIPDVDGSIEDIEEEIRELIKHADELIQNINGLTDEVEGLTDEAKALIDNMNELIDETKDIASDVNGLIKEVGSLTLEVEDAVAQMEALMTKLDEMATSDLPKDQIELDKLYIQRELYTVEANSKVVDTQKQAMDSVGNAVNNLKKAQSELAVGWNASIDGVVTECNLAEGVQTSALETGIKVENLDSMVATISLGEYDIHKVRLGMPASITTAYGKYTGEISFIAPVASGGSSGSILDNVGSMAGISGLSSLTASGAGVECKITIDDPDENIIAGFDADIEIETGSFIGVPVVPIESIILEKTGTYVYLYNEEEGTVTKTQITTGAISDKAYEIKEGIKLGDKIVTTPSAEYEEETFKVKVVNE